MRLLFVADGRSPTALNWIRYFSERGDDVFLAARQDFSEGGADWIPGLGQGGGHGEQ